MWRAMLAALAGSFEEAERLTAEGERMGRRAQDENAGLLFEVQRLFWRQLMGTLSEKDIDAIEQRAGTSPASYAWHAALAETQAARGREEDAREWLQVTARDVDGLPLDANWLYTLAALGRASAAVGELPLAESIYELILPYGSRNVVAGRASICLGSASLVLGEMAAALGRPEEADRHFAEALRHNTELGAWFWLERTQHVFAGTLELRGEASHAQAVRASSHAGITPSSR
jgi:tetratricopeptide (TPR) repeat protein